VSFCNSSKSLSKHELIRFLTGQAHMSGWHGKNKALFAEVDVDPTCQSNSRNQFFFKNKLPTHSSPPDLSTPPPPLPYSGELPLWPTTATPRPHASEFLHTACFFHVRNRNRRLRCRSGLLYRASSSFSERLQRSTSPSASSGLNLACQDVVNWPNQGRLLQLRPPAATIDSSPSDLLQLP
jgi:hypothetical protein